MPGLEPKPPAQADLRVGVNIAGYFDSPLGVGEAGRQLRGALEQAGVPTASFTLPERRTRGGTPDPPPASAPFETTLLCVNADAVEGARAWLGPGFAEGHTIGFWWWEVDTYPDRWRASFDALDELWVGSRFVADAIAPVSPVPVLTMPLPVFARRAAGCSRAQLGLPEGFLFLFVFDFASGFERKNPLGLIDAFSRAFSPGGGGPALAIKHIGGEDHPEQLAQLTAAAAEHADVHLLGGYLEPDRLGALNAAADCFVSLHRSEGFGLTLAEAVGNGVPVVATGYSGPMDFLDSSGSFLVRHGMTEVGPGNDPYPAEAHWADPDLDHAAELMRAVHGDPAAAARMAVVAKERLDRRHTPAAAGTAMAERLARLAGLPAGGGSGQLDELERRIAQWPPPPAGGTGPLRRALRSAVLRLGRPRAVHERRVNEEMLWALRDLEEQNGGLRSALATLSARVDELERDRDGGSRPPV